MLKKNYCLHIDLKIFTFIYKFINSQEVLNLSNMGNVMNKIIISQFHIHCVLKSQWRGIYQQSLIGDNYTPTMDI